MKLSHKLPLNISTLLITACILQNAHAGIDDLYGELSSPVEVASAKALLATYNDLTDEEKGSCIDSFGQEGCTGDTLKLFNNIRQILHTANQITNRREGESNNPGPTTFSLINTIDPDGLITDDAFFVNAIGNFLRWNSGEEYAAQGSMSNDFIQGQTSALTARLSTLRMGAGAFGNTNNTYNSYALLNNMSGGGAGEDSDSYSRWSGFLNYTQGSGTKAPTGLEDAFDVDSGEITGGVDYRVDNNWVVGAIIGYTDQELEFDRSKSIVEGGITSDGFSVVPFMLFQDDSFYLSFSAGYQALSFDTERSVDYAYVDINTKNVSSTDSATLSFSSELGYTIQKGIFSVEPFYKNNYANTRIDAFTERDLSDSAFNLAVDEQRFSALSHSLGLKAQLTFSTGFGVIVPYASYQANNERHTGNTAIAARFANAGSSDATFLMGTDENDENYGVFSTGISSVIRGSRQTTADSAASGGIQVFASYKKITELENYDFDSYALGIRYEF